jgi:hypothetical protein
MHDKPIGGEVGVQVIWYDEQKRGQTCTSRFNVGGDPDQLLRASARSGILQLARLLNMLLRRNTPPDVECLTNDELDVAAAVRKKTFLYRFFMNLATGRDETPTQAEPWQHQPGPQDCVLPASPSIAEPPLSLVDSQLFIVKN